MAANRWIREISILMGISIVTAFTVNFFSPSGIALVGQWDSSKGVITAKAQNDVVTDKPEIEDVKRAKEIYDGGNTIFVDARTRKNYEDGHVPGAISLPVGQFDELIGSFLDTYSPEHPIVTYCSGRTCEDSHRLAQLFRDIGFINVKVFIDGFPGWKAEGYPVE